MGTINPTAYQKKEEIEINLCTAPVAVPAALVCAALSLYHSRRSYVRIVEASAYGYQHQHQIWLLLDPRPTWRVSPGIVQLTFTGHVLRQTNPRRQSVNKTYPRIQVINV